MVSDSVPTVSRTQSLRAFEAVAVRLREELASGRFPTGDRLPSERALSERFGVSRNTLREALRSLEHAGLIRLQKGATGGAFVTGTSGRSVASGLMDLYQFGAVEPAQLTQARIWLESIVIREACSRATPADLAELAANIEAVTLATDDFPRRVELHLEFHRVLARMTGNPVLVSVMNGLLDVFKEFAMRTGPYPNPYTVVSRRKFLDCFAAGDVPGAVQAMTENLLHLQEHYFVRLGGLAPSGNA